MKMEKGINYKTFLLFYADTPGDANHTPEKNKLFKWEIPSIVQWRERLEYWIKRKFIIRSAYVEEINTSTGEVTNQRIEDAEILAIVEIISVRN